MIPEIFNPVRIFIDTYEDIKLNYTTPQAAYSYAERIWSQQQYDAFGFRSNLFSSWRHFYQRYNELQGYPPT